MASHATDKEMTLLPFTLFFPGFLTDPFLTSFCSLNKERKRKASPDGPVCLLIWLCLLNLISDFFFRPNQGSRYTC
jgi:hypothetical protein